MAERVLQATVTIPAGTPVASPLTFELPFTDWDIEAIDLEVGPGPGGTVGFYLGNNGHPFIPRSIGEFFQWDDKIERFPVTDYPNASGWEITGYNVGKHDHNVVARFHVNALNPPSPGATLPVLTFVERGVRAREPIVL